MKLLAGLTGFFLSVFGITRPKPEQLRTASLIVGGLMLVLLVAISVLVILTFTY